MQAKCSAIYAPESWTEALPLDALFNTPATLEVDVGCGKGRFLLARASSHPQTSFIGIDKLLRRVKRTDRKISMAGLQNVRILRIEAAYAVEQLLPTSSVSAFYIFFPDPWPKRRHHQRRLFSASFMDSLHRTLLPGGLVHIATDYMDYFKEICALFHKDERFAKAPALELSEEERTDFELLFIKQGMEIGRGSFSRKK